MAALSFRKQSQESDDDVPSGTMAFLEHLDELRTRIIRSFIALAIGMLLSFTFIGRIADFVLGPTLRALPAGTPLIMTRFGEGLSFYMDLPREKRLAVPFIMLAAFGTVAGAVFSHYVLFPSMVAFFSTFDSPRIRLMPRVEDTFGLYKTC